MREERREERKPLDPTRKLLRVFGVKVTTYEERSAELLRQAAETPADQAAELLRISAELVDLTADLSQRLREMSAHVLETQERALNQLSETIQKARGD